MELPRDLAQAFDNLSQKRDVLASTPDWKCSKPHRQNGLPPTQSLLKQMMKNPPTEIKCLDDLAEWCAVPKGKLQNHIAWCF
jgi:hypothetical protein